MICYFSMQKTWNLSWGLQPGIAKIYSLRYKLRSSWSRGRLSFNHFQLHAPQPSFTLLSKCKKGKNLLQFEVISLKTTEEMKTPRPWRCPARSLPAKPRSARFCPCVSRWALHPSCPPGDTGRLSPSRVVTAASPRSSTLGSEPVLTP